MITPENFDKKNENDLLISSYNSIKNKSCLEIVTDELEKKSISEILFETLQLNYTDGDFSIQNLFKLKHLNGSFYIGQCLFDFGISIGGGRYDRSLKERYHYDTVGFGISKTDLGETLLRQKTTADKLVEHFIHSTIQINNSDVFNENFYLISDKKENIVKCFDSVFVNTISKYNGLTLRTKGNKILLVFENHLEENQSGIVEDIFSAFKYWEG